MFVDYIYCVCILLCASVPFSFLQCVRLLETRPADLEVVSASVGGIRVKSFYSHNGHCEFDIMALRICLFDGSINHCGTYSLNYHVFSRSNGAILYSVRFLEVSRIHFLYFWPFTALNGASSIPAWITVSSELYRSYK